MKINNHILRFLIAIYWLLAGISLQAQTAWEAFTVVPENLLSDLSVNARMDLIDLYRARQEAVVTNSFNDSIVLENLTSDYLLLNTGKGSLQILVLPMINESRLYCVIHTVCAPVCDSRIEFYSISWKLLQTDTFIQPADKTAFIAENQDFPALDISLMQWMYDPGTSILRQTYNTLNYLSLDDRKMIQPFVKAKTKDYKWTGVRFE